MTTHYDKIITAQSTAVRTNIIHDVKHTIADIKCDMDSVIKYSTDIIHWLKPIINLTDFYVYPMNGITEGLNWWYYREPRAVTTKIGDYQWIEPKPGKDCILYLSVPSAINGNVIDIPNFIPTAVDLAYVGSTKIKQIKISKNTEYVFYSLSKSFGIRNVRTGWFFTKQPDQKLENLTYNAKYYNYLANSIAEKIINNFDIDFVYNKLCHKQKKICNDLGIVPSDSVWLATSIKKEYYKFRRSGDTARLCLAGCYNE